MPLSFASRTLFRDNTKREASIHVQTNKTFYNVVVTPEKVYILAPGLEETFEREDFPEDISYEGLAVIAVVRWEEET